MLRQNAQSAESRFSWIVQLTKTITNLPFASSECPLRLLGEGPPLKLPNLDRASVSEQKVAAYLLNPKHPDGAGKATLLLSGFAPSNGRCWPKPSSGLRRIMKCFGACKPSTDGSMLWKARSKRPPVDRS